MFRASELIYIVYVFQTFPKKKSGSVGFGGFHSIGNNILPALLWLWQYDQLHRLVELNNPVLTIFFPVSFVIYCFWTSCPQWRLVSSKIRSQYMPNIGRIFWIWLVSVHIINNSLKCSKKLKNFFVGIRLKHVFALLSTDVLVNRIVKIKKKSWFPSVKNSLFSLTISRWSSSCNR